MGKEIHIIVKPEIRARLEEIGVMGDSFNDVIIKLLDSHDKSGSQHVTD